MSIEDDFFSSFRAAKLLCKASDWTITNLKLHKMLYLIELDYIKENKKRLITDELFQAWKYGPVLPKVYERAKIFGADSITADYWIVNLHNVTNPEKTQFVKSSYSKYKGFTNLDLIKRTYEKLSAWYKIYKKDDPIKKDISFEDMKEEMERYNNGAR